jgi:starch-binding outer membrane protein, SusD/RagB family
MHPYRLLTLLLLLAAGGYSCKKSSFLDTPPTLAISNIYSIANAQAVLDNDFLMNGFGNSGYPYLGFVGSDDYYCTTTQYTAYTETERQAVSWSHSINTSGGLADWSAPYQVVFAANTALGTLDQHLPADGQQASWKDARGGALFFRAFAFYQLAQLFAPAYDSNTAATDPGIPLRLTADVSETLHRATVQQTYDQLIADLDSAGAILPSDSAWYPTRPAKAAVYGMLARVYLSARDYPLALSYADRCLQLQHTLMQYDTIPNSPASPFPFHRFNPEVIFSAAFLSSGPSVTHRSLVDSTVFASYAPNDLRKSLFFKGGYFFGKYDDAGWNFCGLAVDEMVLTRAECYARIKNVPAAMNDLNQLLSTRWKPGTFVAYTAVDAEDALRQIFAERRKELLYRGTRWTDLRRLNKEGRSITLQRVVNGVSTTLPPNDPRYVYPIPDNVMLFNPTMPQNIR